MRVLQKPGKALPTSHPLFRNPANPAAERFFIALFSITFPLYSTFYYITQIPSSELPRTHSQCPGQCVRVCQVARRIIAHRTHVSDIKIGEEKGKSGSKLNNDIARCRGRTCPKVEIQTVSGVVAIDPLTVKPS